MKSTLFTLVLLIPAVGCMSIKPIGPLANPNATNRPGEPTPRSPGIAATAPKNLPTMPVVEEGPKPAPPAYEVTPGEVSETNARECAEKLRKELEIDRANADAMPRYPEVSRVRR